MGVSLFGHDDTESLLSQMCFNLNYVKVLCCMFESCISTMVTPLMQEISLADVIKFGGSNCSFALFLFLEVYFFFAFTMDVNFRETYRTNF